jgi:hypothetical protein
VIRSLIVIDNSRFDPYDKLLDVLVRYQSMIQSELVICVGIVVLL